MRNIAVAAIALTLGLSSAAAQSARAGASAVRGATRPEQTRTNYWLSRDLTRLYAKVVTIKLH